MHTKYLTGEELIEFFDTIKNLEELSVYFYNPYEGKMQTAKCYRGDRRVTMKWNRTDRGVLYNPIDISLIEL